MIIVKTFYMYKECSMFVVKHSNMFNVQRVQYVNCKNVTPACSMYIRCGMLIVTVKHSNMFKCTKQVIC